MGNLAITYQHIADILSFTSSNSKLEKTLKKSNFDWDSIVIEGSRHLVLPAIFCRLKSKKLLHTLPKELESYLEEITAINRNRNKTILKQIHKISNLLNENKIDYVFLKGAALLALGCYEDNAERMVGDIDILVAETQIKSASQIIKNNGYNFNYGYAYKTIDYRHLDRLISNTELAAIELHSNLLKKNYRYLIDIDKVLKSKSKVFDIYIPSNHYLSKHNVYAWQINDSGYYYKAIHLKHYYDSIKLNLDSNQDLLQDLTTNKYGEFYLQIAQMYFTEFKNIPITKKSKSFKKQHINYLDNWFYKNVLVPIKKSQYFFSTRYQLIINNKYYRQHLIKKIFLQKI
ncbi:nucleotidyltransferase family protein [Winogradskyella sp. PG-2]|uniref:nucleotidyltransferase family protein n=1 Tax=Winogradskyella sp. PG-2 TaxID=754409 RepID=UPI0004586618|nr:nucleotidyltransferase family protein [Winogradskyella sp. PG-2]BAO76174.1 hypothetical protein WPG_1944 [Winogradskyella sp. PG-2]